MANATTTPVVDAPRPDWSLAEGARPILFSILFPFTFLVCAAFPLKFDKWVMISALGISAYAAFVTSDQLSPDDTLNDVYSRYILIAGSHMLSMLYQIDPNKKIQPHLTYKTEKLTWSPWYKAYKLLWNIRGVGLPWENPYLWPRQKHTWDAPKSASLSRHSLPARGRASAVAIRCGYLLLNFILIAGLYEFGNVAFLLGGDASDYHPEKESIMRRLIQTLLGHERKVSPVRVREVKVRAILSVESAADNFLIFSLYHDFCAVVFIGLGLDESWEWPPFFGQLTEAYTMRRWWSMFWHRTVYRSFGSHSELILKPLGVKPGSELHRVVTAFNIFGLSAVMHSLVSWQHGNRCAWGRSMSYWILQPVAFILEGFVQAYWRKLRRRRLDKKGTSRLLDGVERGVGYVWVCGFMMWVDAKRNFPLGNCGVVL